MKGIKDYMDSIFQDIFAYSRQLLMPNSAPSTLRKSCFIAGIVGLTTTLALGVLASLPSSTTTILVTFTAVPLVGALTGIPLIVYIGNTLNPILALMISAVALGALKLDPQ